MVLILDGATTWGRDYRKDYSAGHGLFLSLDTGYRARKLCDKLSICSLVICAVYCMYAIY